MTAEEPSELADSPAGGFGSVYGPPGRFRSAPGALFGGDVGRYGTGPALAGQAA